MIPKKLPVRKPMYWIAALASTVLLSLTLVLNLNHRDDWVNRLRVRAYPLLKFIGNEVGGDLYAVAEVSKGEFAGLVSLTPDAVEKRLDEIGFEPNFAASVKRTRAGSIEVGSFAYRESKYKWWPNVLALRQVHVIMFKHPEGTEIYAHEEYNSLFPLVGLLHYRGITGSASKGVKRFLELWKSQYDTSNIIKRE